MEPTIAFRHGPEMAPVFGVMIVMFVILMLLIVTAIKILIFCKIFSKAGYCWALGLLMLVPIANIIMLFVLAFADWPVQREMRLLKQQQVK
jgi:glycerol-3-phosphate acyltransferase PlsY